MDDVGYMTIALELAALGRGHTSPNPMVGAVVVDPNGRVVGKGFHEAVGKPHAEVMALQEAGAMANGATLYVTLEPCNHYGRTPPCTEAILTAGITRVVVAASDPNPDVAGGGSAYLENNGIGVTVGVCAPEARKLNEAFNKYIVTKTPFVVVKCAATLDGRIATRSGDSKWVSGEASRRFVHTLRHELDAIMVGIGTVVADDPSLTARMDAGDGKDPVRIILDTHLSISAEATLLHLDSTAETVVVCGFSVSDDKIARIRKEGVRVVTMESEKGLILLRPLMARLGKMGITSILIEGGSRIIGSAFREQIVDKLLFFFAPRILGGNDGTPICNGPGPELMKDAIRLRDLRVHRFGNDLMIEGYVD
ncbi:Diaminohydroxyphosphoribosylaminopyrimidine deaminase (EC / 5-amino-6-(5-phosphoribosylamino)uracil reductase (EC [Olavius algarvensis associated proteobacterium Delta 3]|nr:Diaminohydroxyphosphoribosylaminopyrimidine deaminase (EC / 5-amino-6-(5-phosphoribosylamino)uracil reductase (EC [Olavius algarvensis associated proteobacterium Delta 3]CAB5156936.1 Diaminohydroxyphosphoribosylaminopyrimidine deaminase (EC / 5-amino-6-(5-phosphoribosylamino)uracil reductase (EC [Olavius algarvensis associated proteobacterium Delta 3]